MTQLDLLGYRDPEPTRHHETEPVDGCCPSCARPMKLYRRTIYSSVAADLIKLHALSEKGGHTFYHRTAFAIKRATGGGDFAKLQYWGLVEEMQKDEGDTKKRTSGFWRITCEGQAFVKDELRVPKTANVYLGEVVGFSQETIGIREALKEDFDYGALMAGSA